MRNYMSVFSIPDSKVHGANMGPIWVLSTPDGPHVGPMNLAIRDFFPWLVLHQDIAQSCDGFYWTWQGCPVVDDRFWYVLPSDNMTRLYEIIWFDFSRTTYFRMTHVTPKLWWSQTIKILNGTFTISSRNSCSSLNVWMQCWIASSKVQPWKCNIDLHNFMKHEECLSIALKLTNAVNRLSHTWANGGLLTIENILWNLTRNIPNLFQVRYVWSVRLKNGGHFVVMPQCVNIYRHNNSVSIAIPRTNLQMLMDCTRGGVCPVCKIYQSLYLCYVMNPCISGCVTHSIILRPNIPQH